MRNLFCIVIIVCFFCSPVLSEQSNSASPPKDFQNGLKVTLEASKELGLVEDSEKVKRLNDIAYRVAKRADPGMTHYSFRIVKMEEPNAFALPGGFIFVTTGMLDLNLTDDELAALLGHEITHVRNDHIHRMAKRQTLMNLLYQALVVGVALGIKDDATRYDPVTGYPLRSNKAEVLEGTAAFGMIFQELLLRGFSRELELEADDGGMRAAAGAGFSPKGTGQLFEKMRRKVFEAPGYGYWRTHPYLEDRIAVARSLEASVETSKNPPDAETYREQTQKTLLNYLSNEKEEPAQLELRRMALNSYPRGKTSHDLRWWFIRQVETKEMEKEPFYRDYGKVIQVYQTALDEVRQEEKAPPTASTTSPTLYLQFQSAGEIVQKLKTNLEMLHKEKEDARPLYEEVLNKENFDTEMLKRYLSNYPDSKRIPEVQFRLAENYRILQKHQDAVPLYLGLLKTESDWKEASKKSLIQLVPKLQDLSSCYKILLDSPDQQLKKLSDERMQTITVSYDSLKNGYEFRRNYPASPHEKPVLERMTKLASDTLNQGKIYQAVGEYQKALDQYNQILRYCSDLPIADQVKDNIVSFQELTSSKG